MPPCIFKHAVSIAAGTKKLEFFATECADGRILGHFDHTLLPMEHINWPGVVPKTTPGKYRLI